MVKGIKKEELPRIFDKGVLLEVMEEENEKSTGMGLYLVYKLCKKLDIDIKAESIYGEFTAIKFTFNIVR